MRQPPTNQAHAQITNIRGGANVPPRMSFSVCLLYTSDAADERSSVDLGGRRIIKKKKEQRDITTNN